MFEVTVKAKCETADEALKLLNELENCVGKNNAELEDSNILSEDGEAVLPSLANARRPAKPNVGDAVLLKDRDMASFLSSDTPIVMNVFDTLDEDWGEDGYMATAQREFEDDIGEHSAWYAIVGDAHDSCVIGDHEIIKVLPKKN